ncbi:glucosamine 6-phosphate N-acetyltransferase [Auricularia subglabra TFB-10046 SS5]|nr:glucosamine 6-phosphate N-acetyltransferase [Auricularia subglabra TFB-10046 SS5]
MPFTPDSELELLFDPTLIPQNIRNELPEDLHIRPLASTDNRRGHLRVLSVLAPTPEHSDAAYTEQFNYQRSRENTYFTVVVVHKPTDTIVASGSVFVERKFLRQMARVGHLEDVAVDQSQHRRNLGGWVVRTLLAVCDANGCYKMTGNGLPHNIPFYEKLGLPLKDRELKKYVAVDIRQQRPKL